MDYSKAANPASRQPASSTLAYRPPPLMRQRPPEITEWRINDWKCNRCGCDNFRRRENCFQCNIPRSEGEASLPREDDGYDQVGSNPCNTLLLRGLDALTTEPSILNSLSAICDIEPKNICVVSNPLTGLSRGYAVVEFSSIRESTMILDMILNLGSSFEVDGKAIIVSYAKNTYNTLMTVVNRQDRAMRDAAGHVTKGNYPPHVGPTSRPGPLRRVADPTNAAEVAEAALLASRLQQQENGDGANVEVNQPTVQTNAVTAPDVNTFVFDESSGYYYDANTGFYYDANTQYFYSPQTSQFMYWDSAAQAYLPAPTTSEAADNSSTSSAAGPTDSGTSTGTTATAAEQAIDKQKAERAKQAKKIVKDMERWAKVQNAQKESGGGFKKPIAPVPTMTKKESATADAGFAAISKVNKSEKFTIELMKSREDGRPFGKMSDDAKAKAKATQLVASYGGDSESEEETEEPPPLPPSKPPSGGKKEELNLSAIEASMTDWDKLTCLLCKRLFNTKEALQRHQQMSDLHKSNLEELKKSLSASKGR